MLKHARRSISEINYATERIAALRDLDSGTVRLTFLHSLASWLFPDLLRRFRSAAPRVQFTLSQAAAYEMVEFLAGGPLDLAATAPGLRSRVWMAQAADRAPVPRGSARSPLCPARQIAPRRSRRRSRSSHGVRNSQCVQ